MLGYFKLQTTNYIDRSYIAGTCHSHLTGTEWERGGGLTGGALCRMSVLRDVSCYVADDQLHRLVILFFFFFFFLLKTNLTMKFFLGQ